MTTSEPNFGYPSKSSKDWWRSIVFSTFNHASISLSPNEGHGIFEHLFEEFKEAGNWDVYEEVHPVLRKLKQESSRIKLGVVSNFDERLHDIMRNTKLDKYFDFVLASRDVGIEKPNPMIFQRALELASTDAQIGVLAREALHIGDHIKKDYEAARIDMLNVAYGNLVLKRHEVNLAIFSVLVDEISHGF